MGMGMGMAWAWRLGLGLLLLALFSPTQTSGENRTTSPVSNVSEVTAGPVSTLNRTTTRGHGNSLQSTAGLFILSVSLLYIC